jgi:hypothetical protein
MKMAVFWVVGLLRRVVWYKFTDVAEVLAASIMRAILITEAASISKTSVNFYQITRRNNPEDTIFRSKFKRNMRQSTNKSITETVHAIKRTCEQSLGNWVNKRSAAL